MRLPVVLVAFGLLAAGCSPEPAAGTAADTATTTTTLAPTTSTTVATTTTTTEPTTTTTVNIYARPDWLGTRLLALRPDEFGEVVPTPPELQQRAFETYDLLPPPEGDVFVWTISSVPPDVVERSTWREDCPVPLDELSYITVSHWGFDQKFHTGEMIVNAAFDEEIVGVFEKLHAARFPIEQMRVV
ncbi:MAG: M15 family peptidase, partial [Acidimicrobiia bacterium]